MFLYVEQDVNLAQQSCSGLKNVKTRKKMQKSGKNLLKKPPKNIMLDALCRMTWLYINNNATEHWTSTLLRVEHGKPLIPFLFSQDVHITKNDIMNN